MDPSPSPSFSGALSVAVAGAVVLALGVLAVSLDAFSIADPSDPEAPALGGPPPAPAPDPGPVPQLEPSLADEEAVAPSSVQPSQPGALVESDPRGPCRGERGVVLGYAYAGDRRPGRRGEVWLVRQSVYVRADYPRADNDWDARAPIRCVLPTGARVELRKEPIAIDGGAYWVPVLGQTVSP